VAVTRREQGYGFVLRRRKQSLDSNRGRWARGGTIPAASSCGDPVAFLGASALASPAQIKARTVRASGPAWANRGAKITRGMAGADQRQIPTLVQVWLRYRQHVSLPCLIAAHFGTTPFRQRCEGAA